MIYNESPRRQQIAKQVSWGHWFALANIFLASVISSVYLFSTPISETPLSFVYLLINWLGHTSFITFLGFIVCVLPLCYTLTNMRVLRAVASLVAALGLAVLAFDALLYNKTGFHISFSSADLLRSEAQGQIGAFGWLQWFYLVLLFVVWLMFQLVIANAIYKRIGRFQRLSVGKYLSNAFLLCFVASHGIHVWADANLYTPVLKQDNMFPLSYPATAKTLMARYGLLDLEQRQQKQELQYNSESKRFDYPPQQVFCSVDNTKKIVVLALQDSKELNEYPQLRSNAYHLNLMQTPDELYQQLVYGLPENLLLMAKAPPVANELLTAFDVNTASFVNNANATPEAFDEFAKALNESDSGFYLAILDTTQLAKIDLATISDSSKLLVIYQDEQNVSKLANNFLSEQVSSSNEDIIPTVLNEFGCLAEANRYSTGQNLADPERSWMVSTQSGNIVLVKYPLLTIVASDGSFEVTDLSKNGEKVLVELDTNLLSRSIKHLKDFSDK